MLAHIHTRVYKNQLSTPHGIVSDTVMCDVLNGEVRYENQLLILP